MSEDRRIKLNKNFVPLPAQDGDEIYPNGIFHFAISRMLEDIVSGKLVTEKEKINVHEWFKSHWRGSVTEEHLPTVDVSKPVIQAEIKPGTFEIIDGNHRLERACRDGTEFIDSYKLRGEQLLPYFSDVRGYKAFAEYWNSKFFSTDCSLDRHSCRMLDNLHNHEKIHRHRPAAYRQGKVHRVTEHE